MKSVRDAGRRRGMSGPCNDCAGEVIVEDVGSR